MYYGIAFDLGHWKAAYALGRLYAANLRKQAVWRSFVLDALSVSHGWLTVQNKGCSTFQAQHIASGRAVLPKLSSNNSASGAKILKNHVLAWLCCIPVQLCKWLLKTCRNGYGAMCCCSAATVATVVAAGVGHNCEYAEKYLWQFVSQRSGWLSAAQAALLDYDSPSSIPATQPGRMEDPRADTQANADPSQGELAGSDRQSGIGSPADVRDYTAARMPGRYPQALLRYLLLAEAGCEAAAENAAWMLLHAQGASGPRAMGLAAHLLYR